MCSPTCPAFGARVLAADEICGLGVLEVGPTDANGSPRPQIEAVFARRYLGVDLAPGRGVDEVWRAADLEKCYGRESFDVVLATEMVEHPMSTPRLVQRSDHRFTYAHP